MSARKWGKYSCVFVTCMLFIYKAIISLEWEVQTAADIGICKTTFLKYSSSPLEQKWIENVKLWQNDVCLHISDNEMSSWLDTVSYFMKNPNQSVVITNTSVVPTVEWTRVMSTFTYQYSCSSSHNIKYVHVPVEPTVGLARDPRKCWDPLSDKYTQSKDYLLPLSLRAALLSGSTSESKPRRAYLFDAGATVAVTRNHRHQWSGTDWIYSWYESRGVVFDEVHAWEPNGSGVNDYSHLSPLFAKALHFYPNGVSDVPGNMNNPLHLIAMLCRPEDLVIFKLDIDSDFEINIVHQLLKSPLLRGLIDEFFYEHHIRNYAMRKHGLNFRTLELDGNVSLASWYDMVIPARKAGFRMHFWP